MNKPTKKEIIIVQLMLGISLLLAFLPPLILFFIARKEQGYYREASRKALNFHMTVFPLFLISSFLPSWVKYLLLAVEYLFIINAIICIKQHKPYSYPAIPYIKRKEVPHVQKYDDNRTTG